jgi:hypothetical protein
MRGWDGSWVPSVHACHVISSTIWALALVAAGAPSVLADETAALGFFWCGTSYAARCEAIG